MPRSALLFLGVTAMALAAIGACSPSVEPPSDAGPSADAGTVPGGQDGGADAGAEGLSVTAACPTINANRCAYLQQCGVLAEGTDALRDCELYFTATECGPAHWPVRVSRGTLKYDGQAAASCAAGWSSFSCADLGKQPASCYQLTSPAAPIGGKCYGGLHRECTTGACTGATCPRQCQDFGDVGAICEIDTDCKQQLYCRRTLSGGAGTCEQYGESSAACDDTRPCAPGYFCGGFSVCQPVKKIGEPCEPGWCESSAWCSFGSVDGGVCTSRYSQGAACNDGAQCRAELQCILESGTCQSPGPLQQGSTCARSQRCATGLACVGTQPDPLAPPTLGTCQMPVAQGGACTSSYDCAVPFACVTDGDGGVCSERRDDGDSCTGDRDCQLFSRCSNGICRALPRPGEPCQAGTCLFGTCLASGDGGTLCKGLGESNAPCSTDEQCASFRCVSGACLAACPP